MTNRSITLWLLLVLAAGARLLLQLSAMPPYAGLDEAYHVARLEFRFTEGRNPSDKEPSVATHIHQSLSGAPEALPAFGPEWPSRSAQALANPRPDRVIVDSEYLGANYEAQHPSLYYSIAAPALSLVPTRTQKAELRLWRSISVVCALIVVLAAAYTGWRFYGAHGLLAAALLVSFPTWLTVTMRASNDAFSCALIAIALSITLASPREVFGWIAEATVWSLALAAKLYSWPLVLVLALSWRVQRATRTRVILVGVACSIAILLTVSELSFRTSNPLGLFSFNPVAGSARVAAVPIDYVEMAKIWIATLVWTSGQHWNALEPMMLPVYFGPFLLIAAWGFLRASREQRLLVGTAAIAFAAAQALNAWSYIRLAQASGQSLPAGGKEGWYWYVLAPLILVLPLASAFAGSRKWLVVAIVGWLLLWDIILSEGALFRDYAGLTSPATPSALFRWGPTRFDSELYDRLRVLAVGPFTSFAFALRLIHVIAMAALVTAGLRRGAGPKAGSASDSVTE